MTTYTWDEISGELVRVEAPQQQDGEWKHVRSDGAVTVWRNSRGHTAIDIEWNNREGAQRILESVHEYREWNG